MFIDARKIPENGSLNFEVCVIGGGVAGITTALHFDEKPVRVCLLESGDYDYNAITQELYRGNNVGLHYERLDWVRSRFLGGSSNCWGGWCRPLDAIDFEKREWVDHSGWPITKETLVPYYDRAYRILKLDPDFDPERWQRDIGRSDVSLFPFDRTKLLNLLFQFAPCMVFRSGVSPAPGQLKKCHHLA